METNELSMLAVQKRVRAKRIKRRIFYLALLLMVGALLTAVVIKKFFIVNEINVSDTVVYSKEEIAEGSGISIGMNMLSVHPDAVSALLKEKFPFLVEADVTRSLPDSVDITVDEERGPMYICVAGEMFALSPELKVLSRIESPSAFGDTSRICLVNSNVKSCIVGSELAYADENTLDMTREVYRAVADKQITDKVSSIDLTDKFHIALVYDNRFNVQLGNSEDLSFKIALFLKVTEQLYDTDKGEIDVSDLKAAYVKLNTGI